jgi:hypothetical protein
LSGGGTSSGHALECRNEHFLQEDSRPTTSASSTASPPTKELDATDLATETQHHTSIGATKFGRTYNPFDNDRIVATGTEHPSRQQLHGEQVDRTTHTIIQITSVADQKFIPTANNPFQDPLQIDQFVAWPVDCLSEETDFASPHTKIRKEATDNYLETACHSQIRYTNQNKL